MDQSGGLTLIEVIVAMLLLAVLGAALMTFMPLLTRNTQAATLDTRQSAQAFSIFEQLARDWSNSGAWNEDRVWVSGEGIDVYTFIQDEMLKVGFPCTSEITPLPSALVVPDRKRVVITCAPVGSLPERTIRAEFGNPDR